MATSESAWIGDVTAEDLSPWWKRVVAEVVDVILIAVLTNVLLVGTGSDTWLSGHPGYVLETELQIQEVMFVVAALMYYPALMVSTNGQTVGKRLLSIRVVRTDGQRMSAIRAAWREVGLKIILLGLLGGVPLAGLLVSQTYFWADGLWPLWDRENRALHDMLARTRVVCD